MLFILWYVAGFVSSMLLMKFSLGKITKLRSLFSVFLALLGPIVTMILVVSEYESIIDTIHSYIEKFEKED